MSLWVTVALGATLAAALEASAAGRLPPLPAGTTFAAVLRSPDDVPLLLQALAPGHPDLAAAADRLRLSTGLTPETVWALLGVRRAVLLEGGTESDQSLTLLWQGEGVVDPRALTPVMARAALPGTRSSPLPDGTIARTTRSDASPVRTRGNLTLSAPDLELNLRKIGSWWVLTTDNEIFQGGTADNLAETTEISRIKTMRVAEKQGCGDITAVMNPFFSVPAVFIDFRWAHIDFPLSSCWGKR